MDELTALLAQARAAGLQLTSADGKLTVRGPRSAEKLAKELLAHKPDVMAALAAHCDACGRTTQHGAWPEWHGLRLCPGCHPMGTAAPAVWPALRATASQGHQAPAEDAGRQGKGAA